MQNHPVDIPDADADNVGGHLFGICRRSGGAVGTAENRQGRIYGRLGYSINA